jgi:hypothetical protein
MWGELGRGVGSRGDDFNPTTEFGGDTRKRLGRKGQAVDEVGLPTERSKGV